MIQNNHLKISFAPLFILLLCLNSSCLKLPNLMEDDGPAVSEAEYQNAVSKAWGEAYPTDINNQEGVYFEKTVSIVGMQPRLVLQERQQILSAVNKPDQSREYKMAVITAEINENNEFQQSTKQEDFVVNTSDNDAYTQQIKNFMTLANTQYPNSFSLFPEIKNLTFPSFLPKMIKTSDVKTLGVSSPNFVYNALQILYLTCSPFEGYKVTCHNLQTWESFDPAPEFLERPGCGGLHECSMRVKNISFDLVFATFDEEKGTTMKQKILYRVKISPDVPYLSRITSFCYQGLAKVNDTPFVAEICNQVKTFERGSTPSP